MSTKNVWMVILGLIALQNTCMALVLETDNSWRVSSATPLVGWETDADFNESSWAFAYFNFEGLLNGTAIKGIWDSPSLTGGSDTIWVRKRFTLDYPIISARVDVGIDDDLQLYVNGHRVIDDGNGSANEILDTRITDKLRVGENLIAVKAKDSGGNSTLTVRITVESVPPPTTGPVLGSGEGLPGLIGGAFTDFQSDPQAKTLSARLPAGGEAGFVTITPAVRVRSAQIIGDRLVVVYE